MQDSKFGEHLYLTPRVPQGLAAAVEGLTREVLRHRPDNIYAFAARHFENLLKLREQYDDPSCSEETKTLHKVDEAVTECHEQSKDVTDHARQSGWSMNETAKVLEKHRSIFGDTGQKVSTDQIRELANEPVLKSRERLQDGSPRRKSDEHAECLPGTSRRRHSPHQEASKNGVRNAPKFLSQIPIAKDIKTELRRNRISSRERKKIVACEYTRETIIEKSSKKSFEKTKKSYEVRSERKSSRTEDSTKRRSESLKSRTNSHEEKKFTRGASMDSVKNYVVQNFVGMTSLDELQTPSYVEKVQEVIDETSSIIKEKVEALKSGVIKAAKTKQMRKDVSLSSEDNSNSERKNQEVSLSRRNSKSEIVNQEVTETSSLPAVRPLSSSKSTSRSMSARSQSDGALTLPPISPESAKSPKEVKEELVLPVLSPPRTAPSVDDAFSIDDTTAAVEDIAEDITVSSEQIVHDQIVERTLPSGEITEEKIMPSGENAVTEDDKAVTTDKITILSEEKIEENKAESTVEEIVSTEDSLKEQLVPPKEIDDEKAVPPAKIDVENAVPPEENNHVKIVSSPEIKNEDLEPHVEAAPPEEVENEKSMPPEKLDDKESVPSKEIDSDKSMPLEEKNDEETVPAEEIQDENAMPSDQNNDETAAQIQEIHDEKPVPSIKDDEKVVPLNGIVDKKVTIEESKNEKEVCGEQREDDEVIVTEENRVEKEVVDDRSSISKQKHEETTLTTEKVSKENVEEMVSVDNQISTEHITTEQSKIDHLEVKEEEFHDSLNVTPEPFDIKGQRPDSLENSLAEDNKSAASSGHASPLETLKDKLLEIEQVQKRIEDVLDDTKTSKTEGKTDEVTTTTAGGSKIEDKLIEIQESEKRIEQILDSQSTTSETLNSDIKNKLQELEEAERRIESIFNGEVVKETPVIESTSSEGNRELKLQSERKEETIITMITTTTTITKTESLSVPIDQSTLNIEATRAVSPHSFILTEGSPYEIPDSVTRVIIPDRPPSSDSETLQVEDNNDDDKILVTTTNVTTEESNNINDAFGEVIETSEHSEPSTVDIEYIRGIKASHDAIVSRENLDRIKEERDEVATTDVIDSEDEKVLKVVTSSLEEILEREHVEYVQVQELVSTSVIKYDEKQEIVENSLESTVRSVESTNEVKETSATTGRSSLSLDPVAAPMVPELNLDSLPDLTISSFNISEKDATSLSCESMSKDKNNVKQEDSLDGMASETETQEFEKLEAATAAASDINVPAATVDINNIVCSASINQEEEEEEAKDEENNPIPSQCTSTMTIESIDANRHESTIDNNDEEKKSYHIYVPEANSSKDLSTSSETSTFMSAATKIQAGVRGFLTRRRLQSTSQKRSSTLDSVPSIQESFAVETTPALLPIVETSMSEAKARKKLRREDAVQRTTLSVENAFAENQLQHTGESHDCIPLPVFDAQALSMKTVSERENEKAKEKVSQVEQLLEKILLGHAASSFAAAAQNSKLVDVVLLPADTELQNKYLNFITSVEDVFTDAVLPDTPKGVIIEEITSLDGSNKSIISDEVKKDDTTTTTTTIDDTKAAAAAAAANNNDGEETLASISTSEDPLSMNIEEVLGLGEEDELPARGKTNRLNVKLNTVDHLGSSSVSQDSPISDERTRSPVTMMQIAPNNKSLDDKSSEENPT